MSRSLLCICAALLLLACAPDAPADPPLRHALLVSIDTLRADHLGCYGYPRPTSPRLDAFAREAVLFERASATAPWTLPSHASLLTGLYPSRHGARAKRRRLGEVATLAERLRAAGFATGAVVNVPFLGRRYGMARGFDFHQRIPISERPRGQARRVTEAGLAWLRLPKQRPSFLFLHYFDLHSDYVARPDLVRQFAGSDGPAGIGTTGQLMLLAGGHRQASAEDVAYLEGLYDASLRQLDEELGRLFDALRAMGRWDDTLVVVTSDHGEEFGEHGRFSHGFTHYEEMLHVPLLVRWPGRAQGLRVGQPVSLVDVAPTILSALGVSAPGDLDGVDLSRVARGEEAPSDRILLAETGPVMRDVLRSARQGDFKLILDSDANTRQLFDLEHDPEELRDVAEEHPERVRRLDAAISALGERAAPVGPSIDLSPELLRQLEELGYVEDGPPAP